jgi:hypothetical protein
VCGDCGGEGRVNTFSIFTRHSSDAPLASESLLSELAVGASGAAAAGARAQASNGGAGHLAESSQVIAHPTSKSSNFQRNTELDGEPVKSDTTSLEA